jgi:hypothetical protein
LGSASSAPRRRAARLGRGVERAEEAETSVTGASLFRPRRAQA